MDIKWTDGTYTECKGVADAIGHALTTVATKKGDNPDFVGQMLRDISHFYPDLGMKTQWLYSPEGVADLSEAALKAKSDAIAEKMVALIKQDKKLGE